MNGIQIILLCGVVSIFLYYIFSLRNAFFDLLFLSAFSGLAMFFILFPEYTNIIAKKLGVGRGADLLFYICILFFLFITLKLFGRIRRLENKIVDLIRQLSKENAKLMDESKKK